MFRRMLRTIGLAALLACIVWPAAMHAQTATAPVSAPALDDAAVTALVVKIYSQMRGGTVDTALFSPEMAASLTPDTLAQLQAGFTQLGEPSNVTLQTRTVVDAGTNYLYSAVFAIGEVRITILVNHDGKVAGYKLMI